MRDKTSIILVIGAMFCFGTMALFTREANAEILTIATWRAIFVAVVFGIWAMWKEGGVSALTPNRDIIRIGTPYGLFLGLASSSFVGGYAFTTVSNTIFLHNLAPIVAFPLAYRMFRERTDSDAVAGAAIAILGVGLLSGVTLFHFSHFTDGRFLLGDFLAVVSAVGYAGVLVWTKMTRRANLPILGVLFYAWTIAAFALIVICLIFGSMQISREALLWTLGLAVVCTNIPFYLLNKGMQKIGAGMAALLSMTEVLFATAIGAVFYQEVLAPVGWFGGILVAVGVLYPFMNKKGSAKGSLPTVTIEFLKTRTLRAFMWLLALNLFTLLAMQTGSTTAAWIAAAALLRIGADPIARLLEGRRMGILRFSVVGAGSIIIAMIALNNLPELTMSPIWVTLAIAIVALESHFSHAEGEAQDQAKSIRLAMCFLIGAEILNGIDHSAADLVHWVALGLTALSAAGSVLRGIHADLFAREDASDWVAEKATQKKLLMGAFAIYLCGGVKIIESGHVGVLERFGEAKRVLNPGLNLHLPPPIDSVQIIDKKGIRSVEIDDGTSAFLCGDQTLITVNATVEYAVGEPIEYVYGSQSVEDWIKAEARSALIDSLRKKDHIGIITNSRDSIAATLKETIQSKLTEMELGIELNAIHLLNVGAPAAVKDAYLDVISAQEDSEASVKKAEAYHAEAIPRALGKAAALGQSAQSDAINMKSTADIWVAAFNAEMQGIATSRFITLDRLHGNMMADTLRNPIVAPPDMRIWLDSPSIPKESNEK